MTGYAQGLPPHVRKARDVQILRKPFNLEKLCDPAARMTAFSFCSARFDNAVAAV